MTPAQKALALIDARASKLSYLRSRWQDEKDYEDTAEYKAVVDGWMVEGMSLETFSLSPFQFKFRVDGQLFLAKVGATQITLDSIE